MRTLLSFSPFSLGTQSTGRLPAVPVNIYTSLAKMAAEKNHQKNHQPLTITLLLVTVKSQGLGSLFFGRILCSFALEDGISIHQVLKNFSSRNLQFCFKFQTFKNQFIVTAGVYFGNCTQDPSYLDSDVFSSGSRISQRGEPTIEGRRQHII